MTIHEFCALNGSTFSEPFIFIRDCQFPKGQFNLEFSILVYSTEGQLEMKVSDRQYTMGPRCIGVFMKGQSVEIESMKNFKCKALILPGHLIDEVNIPNSFLTLFILEERPVFEISVAYGNATNLFLQTISKVLKFSDNPYKGECLLSLLRSFFYSTGYFLFSSLSFKGSDLYRISEQTTLYGADIMSRFMSLVEENASTMRNISFYADELGYHPKYLSTLIKKHSGHTAQQIIDQYASLKARAKLVFSTKSVKEISNEMDFPTPSDFGKYFKRLTGESPLSYRKTHQRKL